MELSQIPAAFHSKLRLAVIAALLSGPKNFRALQDLTGATPGNLGKQLEVLEAEGYLRSEKAFVGRRPNTTYTLLPYGREQFAQYVALLESLLAGAQGVEGADAPSSPHCPRKTSAGAAAPADVLGEQLFQFTQIYSGSLFRKKIDDPALRNPNRICTSWRFNLYPSILPVLNGHHPRKS